MDTYFLYFYALHNDPSCISSYVSVYLILTFIIRRLIAVVIELIVFRFTAAIKTAQTEE